MIHIVKAAPDLYIGFISGPKNEAHAARVIAYEYDDRANTTTPIAEGWGTVPGNWPIREGMGSYYVAQEARRQFDLQRQGITPFAASRVAA